MKIKLTKLDKLWSTAVKQRDKYQCRKCRKFYREGGRGIQAAHIMPRRHKTTRWDLENGLTLCFACHHWAHSNPVEFTMWLIERLGQRKIDKLRLLSNMTWDKDTLKWEMYLKTQVRGNDAK